MTQQQEVYLGDGVYASYDGFGIWLRAPREGGDHVICLEPDVYMALSDFVDGIVEANMKMLTKIADRRDHLCHNAPRCPSCNSDQVQLLSGGDPPPASWHCRICKRLFAFEPQSIEA